MLGPKRCWRNWIDCPHAATDTAVHRLRRDSSSILNRSFGDPMNPLYHLKTLALGALIGVPVGETLAQQAVTVSGHVTAGGAALVGAHVQVAELRPLIDRVTDESGY